MVAFQSEELSCHLNRNVNSPPGPVATMSLGKALPLKVANNGEPVVGPSYTYRISPTENDEKETLTLSKGLIGENVSVTSAETLGDEN